MKLYHCHASRGLRALWTIEEIGLDCELISLPFPPRYETPGFLALNPLGTVPVLVDGETVMTESSAIAQYLAERYSTDTLHVGPGEADRGPYLDFLNHADATLTFPQTVYLRFAVLEKQRGLSEAGELYARWFSKRLVRIAGLLETRDYLCADRFTAADIAVGYAIKLAHTIGIAADIPRPVERWFERITDRPAYRRTIARDDAAPVLPAGERLP